MDCPHQNTLRLADHRRSREGGGAMLKNTIRFGFAVCLMLLNGGLLFGHDHDDIKVEVLTKSGSSWDGTALPIYPKGKPEITILRITVPPKTKLAVHEHPVINAGVLLRGELRVVKQGGQSMILKAGDALVELVNVWHHGENNSDEPAEIIVFYAGTAGAPVTVKRPEK
jgi:quercetin dioxygenase-like cupin family protein